MAKKQPKVKQAPLRKCPKCNQDCQEHKVHKECDNYGRPFISCGACGGFFWLDKGTCQCGGPLQEFVVKKESPNKGRAFVTCPKCSVSSGSTPRRWLACLGTPTPRRNLSAYKAQSFGGAPAILLG